MMKQSSWIHGISMSVAVMACALAPSAASGQVTMEWVTVGNAGNAADPTTGGGDVSYEFRIGKFEVTNAQYVAFLNAVAASDPNSLYNPAMGFDPRGGITRLGTDGSYTYSVKPSMGDKPVNFVSWYDAARMSNWMTNGQGLNGGSGDTESGVYTFDGVFSISDITRDQSNSNQVFIPTPNEFYKAAYHQPFTQGGDVDDYWRYATRSNGGPTAATATVTGEVANPGQNVVNHDLSAVWNGQDGNVTTVGSAGSTSYYGAFDMNGNLWEWSQVLFGSSASGITGGSHRDPPQDLINYTILNRVDELVSVGFRFASPVPGPCNLADLNDVGAASPASPRFGVPDGALTPTDFSAFTFFFGTGDLRADINDAAAPSPAFPSFGVPDGLLTPTDFSAFAAYFGAGCPCTLPGCP